MKLHYKGMFLYVDILYRNILKWKDCSWLRGVVTARWNTWGVRDWRDLYLWGSPITKEVIATVNVSLSVAVIVLNTLL